MPAPTMQGIHRCFTRVRKFISLVTLCTGTKDSNTISWLHTARSTIKYIAQLKYRQKVVQY